MTEKTKPEQQKQEPVTLVEDPFGITTHEVAHAQDSAEEISENIPAEEALDEDDFEADDGEGEIDMAQAEAEAAAAEAAIEASNADSTFTLDNILRAINEETEAQIQNDLEKVESAERQAQDMAEQLAREIAEDEALAAELAKQDEEGDQLDPELQAALPQNLDLDEMQSCIETLLFMSDKPMSVNKLRELLGPELPLPLFQEAVTALKDNYNHARHGIELVEVSGALQLRTKPGRAALARKLAKVQTQRLSSGAMETLAIVAYKQPVMKEDVDKIRGVDSSYFVRGLLDRKLICISGRSELPGRPMVYSTTDEFLQIFGLKDLSAMPSLRELEAMIPASQTGSKDEDPRVKEMRRLVGQMNSDTSTSLIYDHREDEKILQEIRERVNSIPTSTPTLEEQKAAEKAEKEKTLLEKFEGGPAQPELQTASEATQAEVPNAPSGPSGLDAWVPAQTAEAAPEATPES